MKITFLRHGSLLKPFDDYNALTLQELSQLAKQEIDPLIDPSKICDRPSTKQYILQRYEALFVSESQRTSDTATELSKKFSLPKKVKLKELNEILFDPSKLVTEEEYQKEKLTIIRRRLFKALVDSSNIESGKEVVKRVYDLDKILKNMHVDSILVITHGFFMRYLDIFYRQKSYNFAEDDLNQAINYDYASGFSVIVN